MVRTVISVRGRALHGENSRADAILDKASAGS
jgi:hypothetical protein